MIHVFVLSCKIYANFLSVGYFTFENFSQSFEKSN